MDTEPRTLGGKALKKQRDGSMKQHQKHWGGHPSVWDVKERR